MKYILSIFAIMLAFYRSAHTSPFLADMSALLGSANRILLGDVPYKDFVILETPGTHYLLAGLFGLFGRSYFVTRCWASVEAGITVCFTGLICDELDTDGFTCLLACAMEIIWAPTIIGPYVWYDADVTIMALLTGYLMIRAWRGKSVLSWYFVGVISGLCFWFKQDIGMGIILGSSVGAFLKMKEEKDSIIFLCYLDGVACVFLLIMAMFCAQLSLTNMLQDIFVRAISFKFGSLSVHNHPGWHDRSALVVVALYAYCVLKAKDHRVKSISIIFASALLAGLITHRFQAYSTKLATLGVVIAVLMEDDTFEVGLIAALGMAILGLHYWSNAKRALVPIQDASLRGLYASDNSTDHEIDRLRAHPDPSYVTMNHLVYFALAKKPPHRWMHADESVGPKYTVDALAESVYNNDVRGIQ